jgi:hypothetical protein
MEYNSLQVNPLCYIRHYKCLSLKTRLAKTTTAQYKLTLVHQ